MSRPRFDQAVMAALSVKEVDEELTLAASHSPVVQAILKMLQGKVLTTFPGQVTEVTQAQAMTTAFVLGMEVGRYEAAQEKVNAA